MPSRTKPIQRTVSINHPRNERLFDNLTPFERVNGLCLTIRRPFLKKASEPYRLQISTMSPRAVAIGEKMMAKITTTQTSQLSFFSGIDILMKSYEFLAPKFFHTLITYYLDVVRNHFNFSRLQCIKYLSALQAPSTPLSINFSACPAPFVIDFLPNPLSFTAFH